MIIDRTTQHWPREWGIIKDLKPEIKKKRLNDLLKEFEIAVKNAAKFDEMTGQPYCPEEEKKASLRRIAKEMGITLNI